MAKKKAVTTKKRAKKVKKTSPKAQAAPPKRSSPLNRSLHAAKATKQDEFYTQLSDIEKELRHYTKYFKGKTDLPP